VALNKFAANDTLGLPCRKCWIWCPSHDPAVGEWPATHNRARYPMMLRELDIPQRMDHHAHLHAHNLRHVETRARQDANRVIARLLGWTCPPSAVRARLCSAVPSRPSVARSGASAAGCCMCSASHAAPQRALSGAPHRPLLRSRRRPRVRSWQRPHVRRRHGQRRGHAPSSRVLKARNRTCESRSSARIAGSEGDGARVRDAATYVESCREDVERRHPNRGVEPRCLAEAGGK